MPLPTIRSAPPTGLLDAALAARTDHAWVVLQKPLSDVLPSWFQPKQKKWCGWLYTPTLLDGPPPVYIGVSTPIEGQVYVRAATNREWDNAMEQLMHRLTYDGVMRPYAASWREVGAEEFFRCVLQGNITPHFTPTHTLYRDRYPRTNVRGYMTRGLRTPHGTPTRHFLPG